MTGVRTGTFTTTVQDGRETVVLTYDDAVEEIKYILFSQWDSNYLLDGVWYDADDVRGDCGPADLTSFVWRWTEHRPTVNEVGLACGQPRIGKGTRYTGHAQLRNGAAHYGLTLVTHSKYRPPIYDAVFALAELDAGNPSIALINYGVLREEMKAYPSWVQNQDVGYDAGHWMGVIGRGIINGIPYVDTLDTDFWGARRHEGSYRRIPLDVFIAALAAKSPGCTVGNQGLVLSLS
jgi:hypothetical protein